MDVFKDPVQLTKGINIRDLLNGHAEFQIDMNFKKTGIDLSHDGDVDLFPDLDDDSDSEDIIKDIEESTSKLMLNSPEYMNFKDLATKMIDCVPSGDVKMLIIEEGDGPLVPVDAVVFVHYAAYYESAQIPFDSTLTMNNGEPMKVRLGAGEVIPGLEIGLTSVKGPRARLNLLLQPKAAWGPRGVLPRIRPEPVLFVIKLYEVTDTQAGVRFNDLPMSEQRKFAVSQRTVKSVHSEAKTLFEKRKYEKAIKCYQQSISILKISETSNEKEEEEIKQLKINSYLNLAVCYYKIDKPKYIINMCECLDFIIDIDKNCKAMFYYGRAYDMLGKKEEAAMYYKKALKLEPKNKDIGKALANLDTYNKVSCEKEKEMWQNAFQEQPEKKKDYDVDEDFMKNGREMCEDLAGRKEYSKLVLPEGLMKDEINCLQDLCDKFSLTLVVESKGQKKHVSIIKKV